MNAIDISAIIIAIIALGSSWVTARTSSKATTINNETNARVEMEKEAYNRARDFDINTIERQKEQIETLQRENRELKQTVQQLTERLNRLEKEVHHEE